MVRCILLLGREHIDKIALPLLTRSVVPNFKDFIFIYNDTSDYDE